MKIKTNSSEVTLTKQGDAFYGYLPINIQPNGATLFATNAPLKVEALASKPSGGFRRVLFKVTLSLPKITAFTGSGGSGGTVANTNMSQTVEYTAHMVLKVPSNVPDLWLRMGGIMPYDTIGGEDPNLAFAFTALHKEIDILAAVALGVGFDVKEYNSQTYPVFLGTQVGKGLIGLDPLAQDDEVDVSDPVEQSGS